MIKILTVQTPWDGTKAPIVVDMTRADVKRLQEGRCFNNICRNSWTFLLVKGVKGRVHAAHCWQCAELKYYRGLLSGVPSGQYWVIQNGKAQIGTSWLSDSDMLLKSYNRRLRERLLFELIKRARRHMDASVKRSNSRTGFDKKAAIEHELYNALSYEVPRIVRRVVR